MLQLHSYTVTCNMLRCNCNMLRCNCNLLQLQVTVTGYSYGVTVIGYSSLNSAVPRRRGRRRASATRGEAVGTILTELCARRIKK